MGESDTARNCKEPTDHYTEIKKQIEQYNQLHNTPKCSNFCGKSNKILNIFRSMRNKLIRVIQESAQPTGPKDISKYMATLTTIKTLCA